MYLFELAGLAEIDAIRDEVMYWTNFHAEKKKEKLISTNINPGNIVTTIKDNNNNNLQTVPVNLAINKNNVLSNSSIITNGKKSSRVLESNRRLQSMADIKRSNPNAFQYIGNSNNNKSRSSNPNDISLPPQIIYNNFINDYHKEASNNNNNKAPKSKRSSI